MKYLSLKFENAGLFKSDKSSDFRFDIDGKKSRCDKKTKIILPRYKEIITKYQISNVLCVIFNERPKPSLRKTHNIWGVSEYYFEKAENSYLKINKNSYLDRNNKEVSITEFIQTKKSIWNSYPKSVQINWEIVRRYLDINYDWFVQEVNKLLGVNSEKIPFNELREILFPSRDLFKDELSKRRKTALYAYLDDVSLAGDLIKHPNSLLTNNTGVDYISKYSGEIIVPVDDSDIDRLRKSSSGCATILDGGMVYISKVYDDISMEKIRKFRFVNDISTETY